MKLSQLQASLMSHPELEFKFEDGSSVPAHFHITEVGELTRRFVDCGGQKRDERKINLQLWTSDDTDHRLTAAKFLDILKKSVDDLALGDHEMQVEYQRDTISIYGLEFRDGAYVLTSTQTACLAPDQCKTSPEKKKVALADLTSGEGKTCTPGSGCC